MQDKLQVIGDYQNGNYKVVMMSDGTKIRYNDSNEEFQPEFAESIDINITTKCSQGCPYCYLNCTEYGTHADILKQKWINTIKPYTEIAINGNDVNHPDLAFFLLKMKKQKVIVNMTVNQYQFIERFEYINLLAQEELIHGLGVSLINYDDKLGDYIQKYHKSENIVLHVINGIFNEYELNKIKGKGFKLLVLGYKYKGRGTKYDKDFTVEMIINETFLHDYLAANVVNNQDFETIAFDNLALQQLNIKSMVSDDVWELRYLGEDGKFTFYIDAVNHRFASSSSSDINYPITDDVVNMFTKINSEHENTN